MKYIIHILLLLVSCNTLLAQRYWFGDNLNIEKPFQHKLIITDSVYSFLKSDGFLKGFTWNNSIYILDDTPINQKAVIESRDFGVFLSDIIHSAPITPKTGFKEDSIKIGSIKKRYIASTLISKEAYIDLFSTVIDTTTHYDKPITHFTASLFNDSVNNLLLYNGNYNIISNLAPMPPYGYKPKNKSDEGYISAKRELAKRVRRISISIPVFDSTYTYAFVAIGYYEPKINLLYRREAEGWKLLMAGNQNQIRVDIYGMDF